MGAEGYVFARNELSEEERRLDLLEQLFDPLSCQLLDRVGLPRGGRFLEVGAGRGSIAVFLVARCGAGGQVVATDIDMRWLSEIRHPNLFAVRHDLLADGLDELGAFDVVHARMLLHHLASRIDDALQRLRTLVAPGGTLVIEDLLWDNRYDRAHADAERLEREAGAFADWASAAGLDMHQSLTLPRRLVELGFVDVGNEISGAVRRGGDTFSRFMTCSVAASRQAIPYHDLYLGGADAVIETMSDQTLYYVPWHRAAVWGTRAG